jgi:tight adherence protein B
VSPPSLAVTAGISAALLILGLARLLGARERSPVTRRAETPRRAGPVARHPRGRALAQRLDRAGIPLAPGPFVAAVGAAAAAAAFLCAVVVKLPQAAPAAAGFVLVGARAVVGAGDSRRRARVEGQLPQVAHALAAALGAGLSLRQALGRVARDAPEPVAGELRGCVDELALGARVETALAGLAERLPSRDMRVMVTAILVQRRTGGNLARALAVLAERLDERARLERELRGATAQARLTAWLVAALPVGAGLMAEVASPGTLQRTLGEPPGSLLAVTAALLYATGVVWVRHIGRVEV